MCGAGWPVGLYRAPRVSAEGLTSSRVNASAGGCATAADAAAATLQPMNRIRKTSLVMRFLRALVDSSIAKTEAIFTQLDWKIHQKRTRAWEVGSPGETGCGW